MGQPLPDRSKWCRLRACVFWISVILSSTKIDVLCRHHRASIQTVIWEILSFYLRFRECLHLVHGMGSPNSCSQAWILCSLSLCILLQRWSRVGTKCIYSWCWQCRTLWYVVEVVDIEPYSIRQSRNRISFCSTLHDLFELKSFLRMSLLKRALFLSLMQTVWHDQL